MSTYSGMDAATRILESTSGGKVFVLLSLTWTKNVLYGIVEDKDEDDMGGVMTRLMVISHLGARTIFELCAGGAQNGAQNLVPKKVLQEGSSVETNFAVACRE
jgi:hypothetical protein